jgi:hypothetical protein
MYTFWGWAGTNNTSTRNTLTTISQSNPHLFPASIARPAQPEDIAILAPKLRPECDQELRSLTGFDPLTVLTTNLPGAYIIENDYRQPLAALLVSVAPDNPREGVLHVVVSNDVSRWNCGRHVVKCVSEAVLALHRSGMDTIHSLVDARNTPTATLLVGSGFAFVQRFDAFGVDGIPVGLYTSGIRVAPELRH